MVTPYKTLNDAAVRYPVSCARLKDGSVEVWYMKDAFSTDGFMGYKHLASIGRLPTLKTLPDSHICLGRIDERNLEVACAILQSENWSPHGEANELIRKLRLTHTTMSIGDILVRYEDRDGKRIPVGYIADLHGFKELR